MPKDIKKRKPKKPTQLRGDGSNKPEQTPPVPTVTVQAVASPQGEFQMGVNHTCIGNHVAIMMLEVGSEILLKSLCGEGMANQPKRLRPQEDGARQIVMRYTHGHHGGLVTISETSFENDLIAEFAIQNAIMALQNLMDKGNETLIHLPGQGMPGGPGPGRAH